MKKFWLTTAITGIGCILAGLVLSVILVFGYADELKEYADEFSINADNYFEFFSGDKFVRVTRVGARYEESDTKESYCFAVEDSESINGIVFEIAVGDVQIRTGDTMEVMVTDMFEDAISSYVEEGIWYITDSLFERGSVHSHYSPDITITIPKDFAPEYMRIYLAAGLMTADNLVAEDMHLEVDAGSLKVFYLMADNSLAIKNGVGEVKIYDAKINNLTIDEGIGAISVTGKITGHNKIKGGIGEVELSLADRSCVDFNYKVTCGIGEVEIGDMSFKGNTTTTSHAYSNADYFEVDCGIGHIEIEIIGH